jgi:chloramphenicol 3-O-phosphotransferase
MTPRIYLISGVMAAGKSTVAQALAERLSRSVHLRGDSFRRAIVSGRAEPTARLSAEAEEQLVLRYRVASAAARMYFEAGFAVVYQDIILGESLVTVSSLFDGLPLSVVVLCPTVEAVTQREAERDKTGYRQPEDIAFFDRVLRRETPRIGLWLDTTNLTPAETVERILADAPAYSV